MARDDDVPNTIPLVGFDENDEPFIVKAPLFRKSPLPAWVAALLIVFAGLTLAQGVYFNTKRSADINCEIARDRALALQIKERQDVADQDRTLLKDLVQQVAVAKTPQQSIAVLQEYLEASKAVEIRMKQERENLNLLLKGKCS